MPARNGCGIQMGQKYGGLQANHNESRHDEECGDKYGGRVVAIWPGV